MITMTRKTPAAGTTTATAIDKLAAEVQAHVTGQPAKYGKTGGQPQPVRFDYDQNASPPWWVTYVAGVSGSRLNWKKATGSSPLEALKAARKQQTDDAQETAKAAAKEAAKAAAGEGKPVTAKADDADDDTEPETGEDTGAEDAQDTDPQDAAEGSQDAGEDAA